MRSTPRLRIPSFLVLVLLLATALIASPTQAQDEAAGSEDGAADTTRLDPELAATISFRSIGPLRGGRSTAVTGIVGEGRRFYMGTTGGGVWTTADAALTGSNITDGQIEVASIGATTWPTRTRT